MVSFPICLRCRFVVDGGGSIVEFTKEDRKHVIKDVIEKMAKEGLRTMAIAFKNIQSNPDVEIDWDNEEEISSDLILISITGIEDPVRPEVFC